MENRKDKRKFIALALLGALFVLLAWSISPPSGYPSGSIVEVPPGIGLYALGEQLKSEHVVSSPFWFRNVAILLGGERRMKAGQYFLSRPESATKLAWRMVRGDYEVKTEKVTVPEGFTVEKISKLFGEDFTFFDPKLFLESAPQGYLFPDTYFVPVTATATSTIKLMHDNFVRKIFPITPDIDASGKSVEDIVKMASLLEAEGKTKEDREMISDILWKRLKLGMPLQVDSDMGTYSFNGLPPYPINNPGLVSIEAAIHPTSTPYLYFLTGKDGQMHYSKTFDEHKANIQKYL